MHLYQAQNRQYVIDFKGKSSKYAIQQAFLIPNPNIFPGHLLTIRLAWDFC